MKLTNSELELMETLWLAERPLPRNEIIELSPDRSWSAKTIHILLNSLIEKGAIVEAGFVKRSKTYGRLYKAQISGEDYFASSLFSAKNVKAFPIYFAALVKSEALTVEMVDELERMLAERKKELQAKQDSQPEDE